MPRRPAAQPSPEAVLSRLHAIRLALVLSIVAGFAVTTPRDAFAHAAFVGASPQPGARVETAPSRITLSFTEPLQRRLSSVKLIELASGKQIPVALSTDGKSRLLMVPRATLKTGPYRLNWHTVSTEDGHALEGSFSFGVRAPAASGEHALEQSPLARNGWLRVVMRALLYMAALPFVAALLLPVLLRRSPSWLAPGRLGDAAAVGAVRKRERELTGDIGWLATSAAVGVALVESADAAGSLSAAALRDFLLGNVAGIARLSVVLLLAGAVLIWERRPRVATALGVLALGSVAVSGHASSVSPRVPSVLNDWLHLLSGSAWLGATVLLALVWGPTLRRADRELRRSVARDVLVPFGRVALPAFALVCMTGLVSLVTQVGRLSALWTTDYGRVLAVKIAIVALIAAVSALHALRLRPRLLGPTGDASAAQERRHWHLIHAEPALGSGVITAVAFLVVFPLPPRQLGDADQARAAAACDPCPLPKPRADELSVATGAGSHLVAAWVRRTPTAVTGTVRVSDIRGQPGGGPFVIVGAEQTSCGTGCERFRTSEVSGFLQVRVSERGRSYVARLPTTWRESDNLRARRLLLAAEGAMRGLQTARQLEEVTSGPGSYARTDYRLVAPDRMAFRTDRGAQGIIVGDRQWRRVQPLAWKSSEYGSGLPFATRRWFRWSTYGRTVRLLREDRRNGMRVAELALFDEGTPVWFRLTVDLATARVLREQMTTKGHFMTTRYYAFNQPLTVTSPKGRRAR